MSQTVLVVGATGLLGAPVARSFKQAGYQVRILSRDPAQAVRRFGAGFQIMAGDVTDPQSLTPALEGCWGVHLNLSGEAVGEGTSNVVEEAVKAGVKRVSMISGTSVSPETAWYPPTKLKLMAEKALQASGLEYTIFRPTWFMEALPNFVRDDRAVIFGRQPNLYHFVAADDYARMVVKAYQLPEAAGKIFFIHGPEGWYFKDALKRYCEVLVPSIREVTVMPHWVAEILALVTGKEEIRDTSRLMSYFRRAGERGDPTEANRLLGAPTTTLDQWLEIRARNQSV